MITCTRIESLRLTIGYCCNSRAVAVAKRELAYELSRQRRTLLKFPMKYDPTPALFKKYRYQTSIKKARIV